MAAIYAYFNKTPNKMIEYDNQNTYPQIFNVKLSFQNSD